MQYSLMSELDNQRKRKLRQRQQEQALQGSQNMYADSMSASFKDLAHKHLKTIVDDQQHAPEVHQQAQKIIHDAFYDINQQVITQSKYNEKFLKRKILGNTLKKIQHSRGIMQVTDADDLVTLGFVHQHLTQQSDSKNLSQLAKEKHTQHKMVRRDNTSFVPVQEMSPEDMKLKHMDTKKNPDSMTTQVNNIEIMKQELQLEKDKYQQMYIKAKQNIHNRRSHEVQKAMNQSMIAFAMLTFTVTVAIATCVFAKASGIASVAWEIAKQAVGKALSAVRQIIQAIATGATQFVKWLMEKGADGFRWFSNQLRNMTVQEEPGNPLELPEAQPRQVAALEEPLVEEPIRPQAELMEEEKISSSVLQETGITARDVFNQTDFYKQRAQQIEKVGQFAQNLANFAAEGITAVTSVEAVNQLQQQSADILQSVGPQLQIDNQVEDMVRLSMDDTGMTEEEKNNVTRLIVEQAEQSLGQPNMAFWDQTQAIADMDLTEHSQAYMNLMEGMYSTINQDAHYVFSQTNAMNNAFDSIQAELGGLQPYEEGQPIIDNQTGNFLIQPQLLNHQALLFNPPVRQSPFTQYMSSQQFLNYQ